MKMILTHYYHDENPDMRRFTPTFIGARSTHIKLRATSLTLFDIYDIIIKLDKVISELVEKEISSRSHTLVYL